MNILVGAKESARRPDWSESVYCAYFSTLSQTLAVVVVVAYGLTIESICSVARNGKQLPGMCCTAMTAS